MDSISSITSIIANGTTNGTTTTTTAADVAAWLGVAASVLSGAASALGTAAVLLARLVAWLVARVALWPLRRLAAVLLVVFSPVIHTVRFAFAPVFFFVNSLPNFEPYYIYFGSAAFVGIIAGTCLQLTSSTVVSLLDLGSADQEALADAEPEVAGKQQQLLDEPSSQEEDWPWLEDQPEQQHAHHPPSYRRRKPTRGLLSQTILEEDDSE